MYSFYYANIKNFNIRIFGDLSGTCMWTKKKYIDSFNTCQSVLNKKVNNIKLKNLNSKIREIELSLIF